jgi:hypothetical protein
MISNCDDVRGMLPWLLNGTLTEEERQQVRHHLASCESCRRDLADTRLAFEMFDQHLPAEAIVALAWGETPPGIDPALVEEHLASCPQCATELELARTSRGLEEDERIVPLKPRTAPVPVPAPIGRTGWGGWKAAALAAGLAGVVASAGWLQTAGRVQTLEERLAEQPAAAAPAPAPSAAGGSGAEAAEAQRIAELERQLQQANEAMTTQQGQIEQLEQLAQARPATPTPRINTWIDTIQPSTDVVRGEQTGAKRIPAAAQATLLLGAAHVETHREHAIEILDTSGKVVWKAAGLALNADYSAYTLTLEPGTLPKGSYTVHVYGIAEGKRELVETYSIRVE